MANNIALTASMRSNLLSLQNTQNLMNKTQDRLSTGYKVNSAMDNPSSYFTAQALNSRANDLSSLLDSIGQAISTLEVADEGITTLQDFVEQAKSIANSARDTSNVSANVSTTVKFDPDTLRSDLVTNQVNGLTAGTSSMTIRLGDATKLEGTTNVSNETTLANAKLGDGSDVGTLSVGGEEYKIDASGTTEQMTKTTTFAVGSVLMVKGFDTVATANDVAILTDADGNDYRVANTTGNFSAALVAGNKVTVTTAASSITQTVDANGRTTGSTSTAANFVAAAAGASDVASGSATAVTNTIYVNKNGTVEDMANTLQNMIGSTRISVTVEDSNLQIKTLDTSSLEVKDGGTIGTGSGFATAFGLDVGDTIKLDANDTAESLRQKIEAMSANMRDGRAITTDFDKDGRMVIKSAEGDDMVISGDLADKIGVTGAATNGSNERAIYAEQFNKVLTQVDQLVQDTSYKGINLLKGDNLTVNFNESRTSTIELKGVNFDATGLGFTQAQNEWRTNANIDKSLEQITKATSMLRAQASEFGQNLSTVQIREDFTKNMINNLQSGADKLTLADMNEEAANMLALQTRQQLGVNSLSLASQASQSVLKLF